MKHQCNCIDEKTDHSCKQDIPVYPCIPCGLCHVCDRRVHYTCSPYSRQETDESESESEEEYDDRKSSPSILLQLAIDAIQGVVLIMALRIIARV